MDDVFVNVMKDWPDAAPNIFIRMARGLDGDEFALFLSGEATWPLRLKVIFIMPKWIFIRSFTRRIVGRYTARLKKWCLMVLDTLVSNLGLVNLTALLAIVVIGLPHGAAGWDA